MASDESIERAMTLLAGNYPHSTISAATAMLWKLRFKYVPDSVLANAVAAIVDDEERGNFFPTIADMWKVMPPEYKRVAVPENYHQLDASEKQRLHGNLLHDAIVGSTTTKGLKR